ncbi:DUF4157 domain-containing protein [Natrarchaeobaculum aegyptiacum]|uniref:eCIS core domain-containing protein n=1 Tax=Natrarchaeobaculum aegyptiacum TaxID=745377 RepID=UPI001E308BB3|nr:DUF4157 domain-containing protein [Natrarchaeobaculum aegyptiacum]
MTKGTGIDPQNVPERVLDVWGTPRKSLNKPVQQALEDRVDADLSDVRIHTGGTAAKAAEAIDARAFTCGNDIVFNAGEYDPESPEGQHLLAHATQQNGGAPISMMPQEGADLEIDPDPQLEHEADQAAEQALNGGEPLVVNRTGTGVHIQRSVKGALSSVSEQSLASAVPSRRVTMASSFKNSRTVIWWRRSARWSKTSRRSSTRSGAPVTHRALGQGNWQGCDRCDLRAGRCGCWHADRSRIGYRISIRHLFLDSGFYQVHVVPELEQLGVDYIIRARLSNGMKARLSAGAETVIDDYLMQRKRESTASAAVTVFPVPHRSTEDEHVWFVTNLNLEPGVRESVRVGVPPPLGNRDLLPPGR